MLSLDADKRITPPLRDEIFSVVGSRCLGDAEAVDRAGRQMRHGGWWPDYCLRLFRKYAACFPSDLVHESAKTSGPVARLSGHIQHHPVRGIEDMLRRSDNYSSLGARMIAARGRQVGATNTVPSRRRLPQILGLKRGLLDGSVGLFCVRMHARTVYWNYAKAGPASAPEARST